MKRLNPFLQVAVAVRWLCLAVFAGLAAGCASTMSATVTQFQQWPGNVEGATYTIVAAPAQQNNLEFQTVADTVRANIGPTGLVQAANPQAARFEIHIDYSSMPSQVLVARYADPYYYDGWGFGPAFGAYHGPGVWGGGVFYSPPVVNVPVQVNKNTLSITINDKQNANKEVYRSSAVNISQSDTLVRALPYLARAVFDGFPGNNGQVKTVNYERDKN
jgi:hypothetical protein